MVSVFVLLLYYKHISIKAGTAFLQSTAKGPKTMAALF